jgi:hypothetical protein
MHGCKSGTAMALLAALGVALAATQATAQQSCDVDGNGYVSSDEAAACAERDYSTMVGDEEAITRERFEQAFAATENVDDMWAEADADQDGLVSSAEWSDWSARRFRSASPRVEGVAVDDYEALEAQYHMGDDQQGGEESGGGGAAGTGDAGGLAQDSDGSGDNGDSEDGGSDSQSGDNGDSEDGGSDGQSGDNGDSDDGGSTGGSGSGGGSGG